MYIACGILFNHESPLRDLRYLTQKVAFGAACAERGIRQSQELNEAGDPIVHDGKLALGNLDAARDWGYAPDYVDAMWRMLQQDEAADYVIGTGVLRSVADLCQAAYAHVGLDWRTHVVSEPRFIRITETGPTLADPSRARDVLQWTPTQTFARMVAEMVDAQRARLTVMPK